MLLLLVGIPLAIAAILFYVDLRWGTEGRPWVLALAITGGVMVALSGLCTGYVVIDQILVMARNASHDLPPTTVIGFALLIGGVPFGLGVVMIGAARKRSKHKPPPGAVLADDE